MECRWPGNKLLWCECCRQKRPAKNCVVQSYYDHLSVWCSAGEAKQGREFRNRSAGQKARFALRHNGGDVGRAGNEPSTTQKP